MRRDIESKNVGEGINMTLVEASLSDGSLVYSVQLGNYLIVCVDLREAENIFSALAPTDIIPC